MMDAGVFVVMTTHHSHTQKITQKITTFDIINKETKTVSDETREKLTYWLSFCCDHILGDYSAQRNTTYRDVYFFYFLQTCFFY